MKEIIAGIDLGTTNSAIAFVRDGIPEIIPIDGQPTMPSCVGIDPAGKLIVGQPARNMLIAAPNDTVLSIKRKMGQETRVTLGSKSFSPEEISSFILRRLKEEAEKYLGQPVAKAVITVPAFFDEIQRKATQNAGALAGIDVVRIINEPTAAALAYESGHEDDERLLVYDLGGGTFDVSVVVSEAGVIEVKASHGDTHLGGDDFDQLLIEHVVNEFKQRHSVDLSEDPKTLRRLKVVLERAKCQLSDVPFFKIHEDYIHGDLHLETELDRNAYEKMIAPMLQKTLTCIQQSLQDARILPRDLSKVMLVGAATRTPLVHRLIEEQFHITPRWEINPDLIVAMGAAISGASLAGEKSKSILVDITSHSFGVECLAPDPVGFDKLVHFSIIRRGTPLPVSKSEIFYTQFEGQRVVNVVVREGEDIEPEKNTLIGEFQVEGLSNAPMSNPILVNFNLDLNGMLKVTATEKVTGLAKTVTLDTRGAHSSLNLEEARRNIASLYEELEDNEDDGLEGDDADNIVEMVSEIQPAPDHARQLQAAKDLRKRADTLLAKGIGDEDAAEIHDLLQKSADAVRGHGWEKLTGLNNALSDIVYYLED